MANTVKVKSWLPGFSVAYTLNDAPEHIVYRTVGATALKKGDSVVLGANVLTIGLSNSPLIYGVCLSDGAIGAVIPIAVADVNTVFVGQADEITSGVTAPDICDIKGGTGAQLVDIGENTEKVVNVLRVVPGDDTSDATDIGRVYFQFIRSQFDNRVDAE